MDIINNKYLNLINWYVSTTNNGFKTDGTIEFYKTIRDRDADTTPHLYAWVLDASADPDVVEGSALYQWSDEDGWILIFAAGTNDGSPISMTEIMRSLHTHENIGILENFTEREDGVLLYGGEEIRDSRVDPLIENVSRIDADLSSFESSVTTQLDDMSEAVSEVAASMDNIVSTIHASISRIDQVEADISTVSKVVLTVSRSIPVASSALHAEIVSISSAAHADMMSISSALHAEITAATSASIQTINSASSALTTTIRTASSAAKTSIDAASSALHEEIGSVSAAAISTVSAASRAMNVTINNVSSSITTNIIAVSSALNAKIVSLGGSFDPTELERRVSAVEVEVGLASATLSQLESLVMGDP